MIDPKEPAFPCPETEKNYYQAGLTQRDYLAAMAMQGMLSSHDAREVSSGDAQRYVKSLTDAAYTIADAMIERSRV